MAIAEPSSFTMQFAAPIEALRQKLQLAEKSAGLLCEGGTAVALGTAAIDAALGGGLPCGTLHEVAAARQSDAIAASAFALAVSARCLAVQARKALLWIAEDRSLWENGAPYGPGLDGFGIAPERLVTVSARRPRDVLFAMEEALRCRAVAVTIGELGACRLDHVATRRLALAAAAGNSLALLLRTHSADEPCAFATRWIAGAAPSSFDTSCRERRGIGPPRLALHLKRNRHGLSGAWIVEWNSVEQRIELATDSEPVAQPAFDRPHRTATR
jgi:protein ImuA